MSILDRPMSRMTSRHWLALLALGAITATSMAVLIRVPGYMDAEYYYATARQIVQGKGMSEPFLWNYLDDPAGLPHPAFQYWMPLTSLVAALGMAVAGAGFGGAQLPFVLLTATLPILTARVALVLTGDAGKAWFAGLLTAFSGFYLPYSVTTDSFALYAWLGTLILLCAAEAPHDRRRALWLVCGGLVALAHLTRADGILLLIPAGWLAARQPENRLGALGLLVLGYLLVISPWWARNLAINGTLQPAGGARTLWLTRYDDLFVYPASLLTPQHLWEAGLPSILKARLSAIAANLGSALIVTGLIVSTPFIVIGARRLRREPLVFLALVYLVVLLFGVALVFPFSSARGGFFHSSIALVPVLCSLVPSGVEAAAEWMASRRNWDAVRARRLFSLTLLAAVIGITVWVGWTRVLGGDARSPAWGRTAELHRQIAAQLKALDPGTPVVAINDPPGFNLASDLQAVVVPFGGIDMLEAVVDRFHVSWVIVDANRPDPLASLYEQPDAAPWLVLESTLEDAGAKPVYLLRVTAAPGGDS